MYIFIAIWVVQCKTALSDDSMVQCQSPQSNTYMSSSRLYQLAHGWSGWYKTALNDACMVWCKTAQSDKWMVSCKTTLIVRLMVWNKKVENK